MKVVVVLLMLGIVVAAGVWAYREGYLDDVIAKLKKAVKK